ncbi:hypothetical protein CHY08_15120 [Rhizobium leguminosarum bv. viciae]|uniref:DUF2806 domain-containing protein n=1 Tax=Rhizobium leguminosarum TaxID=384 RepID=UPI000B8C887C|nr:DUF2806 domain-containing protein [Rhizobium leguminosarum]ASR08317.1 hypothetical protein CHY08_15120 [Rhizobium leguminosarum bv. viciae]
MSENEEHSIGISVDWSAHGFKAGIKSRWLSALDLLGARRVAASNVAAERQTSISQALTAAHVGLISAARQAVEKEVADDPKLAAKLLMALGRAEQDAENIGGALAFALQDLRNDPASGGKDDKSADAIEPEVVKRWEHYAAGASAEAAREKWGKVLASEIRVPGTFSMKTLRLIDEIDNDTAKLFQRFCANRLGSWVPVIISGLSFDEVKDLREADLLVHSELPSTIDLKSVTLSNGSEWWALSDGVTKVVAINKAAELPGIDRSALCLENLRITNGQLKLEAHILTRSGSAIASIIPQDGEALSRLAAAIRQMTTPDEIKVWKVTAEGSLITEDNVP